MSDTLWTHEPPKEPGWYWRIYRRSPRAEHTPEWTPPVAILVTERRDGLYVDEWRIHADGAFRWCHTPIPPPPLADAPVLSPSETEEEERATVPTKYLAKSVQVLTNDCICAARMVQAAIKVSDFPSGLAELISKLSHLYGTLDEFQKQHAQAVEAAYREGWRKCFDGPRIKRLKGFHEDWAWQDSEAKKKLEGTP